MSFSNNFLVQFNGIAAGYFDDEEVEYFCDEAQLPGVNTATGTINGLYLGSGSIDYPHTRIFTEFQLGFMLDANLTLLKNLNDWYFSIFNETAIQESEGELAENRATRLKYRDNYAADIWVTKTESGPNSPKQRRPLTYVMEKAYPYQIDAIPLQFGSSQITKVTASFKYQRHHIIERDVSGVKGSVAGMDNEFYANENGIGGYRSTVTGSKLSPADIEEAQRQTGQLDINRPYFGTLPGNNSGLA